MTLLLALTATLQQRARVVRLYAFLTAIAGLLVVGVALMRTITHFTYKVNQYTVFLSLFN